MLNLTAMARTIEHVKVKNANKSQKSEICFTLKVAVTKQRSGHSECKNIYKASKTTLKKAGEVEDTGKCPFSSTIIISSGPSRFTKLLVYGIQVYIGVNILNDFAETFLILKHAAISGFFNILLDSKRNAYYSISI